MKPSIPDLPRQSRTRLAQRSLYALPLLLSGCGLFGGKEEPPPPPPPPPPTLVEVRIATTTDVNPSADGSGAPVLIRVYELKGPVHFKDADFFALYEKDESVLASDLVRKSEFFMKPGENRSMEFKADDATQFLGVFAAFRKLDTAKWRALAPIPPNKTTIVDVKAARTQLNLQTTQKAEKKPEKTDD